MNTSGEIRTFHEAKIGRAIKENPQSKIISSSEDFSDYIRVLRDFRAIHEGQTSP